MSSLSKEENREPVQEKKRKFLFFDSDFLSSVYPVLCFSFLSLLISYSSLPIRTYVVFFFLSFSLSIFSAKLKRGLFYFTYVYAVTYLPRYV